MKERKGEESVKCKQEKELLPNFSEEKCTEKKERKKRENDDRCLMLIVVEKKVGICCLKEYYLEQKYTDK